MSRAPQQQRSKDTVEKILAAANLEFAARGSAAATTTSIAEAAGVSVGALYRFFPDKHAIAEALADRYLADAGVAFGAILADVDELAGISEALRLVIRAAADLARDHPGYYRLTQEIGPDDESSVGHSVRVTMLDMFEAFLDGLGARQDPHLRRVAVSLAIETVRHTLATCPTGEPARTEVLDELELMLVTYAERRLAP